MSNKIQLDIEIIDMQFEYLHTDTIRDSHIDKYEFLGFSLDGPKISTRLHRLIRSVQPLNEGHQSKLS